MDAWQRWRVSLRRAVADELKEQTEARGVPISRAGEVLGVVRQATYDRLAGAARLGIDEMIAVAEWVGVDPAEIIVNALERVSPAPLRGGARG